MNTTYASQSSWRRWYVTYEEVSGATSKVISLLPRLSEAAAGRHAIEQAARMGMANATLKATSRLQRR
jgi:hypothetical protein